MIDDLQEATRSTLLLLRALAARGIAIVAFGNPDVAANAFRGGEPDALGRLSAVLGVPGLVTLALRQGYRAGAALTVFTGRIVDRIGTAGTVGHREVTAADEPDRADAEEASGTAAPAPVLSIQAVTPAREWAAIARQLREWHLVHGLDWGRMAAVVRSGAQVPLIARALALAEVPTRTAVGGRALREDHAAKGLLTVIDVAIGRAELTRGGNRAAARSFRRARPARAAPGAPRPQSGRARRRR